MSTRDPASEASLSAPVPCRCIGEANGWRLVELLTDHYVPVLFLVGLLAARVLTTVVSYGVGVPGRIFAPMLVLGTITGMAFGQTAQGLLSDLAATPGAYAVAAMGALFAASVQAPLTGIVLVPELTGNHRMFLAIY